ncbi:Rpn family recombination-promoting nuclease/putative transposase [Salmonella enterica subsp. enterica]|nr:Rpn family recombination-promoting nuclease/putative transposase [Salmonella enterica]EDR2901416.1 Rpn family recombination-promoting nuclease/putative transposase [Salmonella enterica subsp. enterica serovar Amherstiana]EEB1037667.1 Rpn family recombination-promoting nuclease/putative transposase [Salmonella enterica subsp. enterica serovar Typhimurium]EBT6262293.1 Rpn family recombination-promoting nuclease/putative transposase [Salmonella enterica]EEL7048044.1 Rpn family recombination-pro
MNNSGTPHPHDSFFKIVMSQPEAARDFLNIHLPPALLAVCDLDTLQLESASFVDADLRPYISDILWSVETTRGTGYVYALIEHQSRPEKYITFRMLKYSLAAMQRHLDVHKKLPLVIPVLFYAGKRTPYPFSMNWLEAFDDPEMATALYCQDFPLVDITRVPDNEILQHRRVALMEFLLKNVIRRDLMELTDTLTELLVRQLESGYTTEQTLLAAINYAVRDGDTDDYHRFINTLAQRLPQQKDNIMTVAQRLREEGLEKGLEKGIIIGEQRGIEKGRQEGKLEGRLEVARQMLANGMDRNVVMQIAGLSEDDMKNIRH